RDIMAQALLFPWRDGAGDCRTFDHRVGRLRGWRLGESLFLKHALSFDSQRFPGFGHFQLLSPVLVGLGGLRKCQTLLGVLPIFASLLHGSPSRIADGYNSDRCKPVPRFDRIALGADAYGELSRPFRENPTERAAEEG